VVAETKLILLSRTSAINFVYLRFASSGLAHGRDHGSLKRGSAHDCEGAN